MAGVEKDQIEWGTLFTLVLLITVSTFVIAIPYVSRNLIEVAIYISNSTTLKRILWIIPVIILLLHYHKIGPVNQDKLILIKDLGPFVNTLLTGVTYGQLLGASYSIIGKVFLQYQLGRVYFVGFTKWGLTLIIILVSYLSYWAIMELYQMCSDILLVDDVGKVVTDD